MTDLSDWLLEQMAEDEAAARRRRKRRDLSGNEPCPYCGRIVEGFEFDEERTQFVHRGDVYPSTSCPATSQQVTEFISDGITEEGAERLRVLGLQRQIVGQHVGDSGHCSEHGRGQEPCPTLRLMAAVYEKRSGYDREAWRP